MAMDIWANQMASAYPVLYGDNDSVRFALIRGTGLGLIAHAIMRQHLETEVKFNANVWFARVPTEANVADIPSIFLQHPFLPASKDESDKTSLCLEKKILCKVQAARSEMKKGEEVHLVAPRVGKKRVRSAAPDCNLTVKLLEQNRAVLLHLSKVICVCSLLPLRRNLA